MKTIAYIFLLFSTLAGPVQAQRSLDASTRVQDFRPTGELRLWTFVYRDSVLGTLVSIIGEPAEINGVGAVSFKEELNLDYRKINTPLNMHIVNDHYVSAEGYYLGDEMKLTINDNTERMSLKRDAGELKGYMTRGGSEIDQRFVFPANGFGAENNFLDQYELFWAMRDFKAGDTVVDTVFMPQSMVTMPLRAVVEKYEYLQVYNQVYDSAFVIHYSEPQEQYHYFTPDKRLIKAWIPSQNIRVFLDAVRQTKSGQQEVVEPPTSPATILTAYFIYLLVAVIAVAFFIGSGYRWPSTYWAIVMGAMGFLVAIFTQIPIQKSLINDVFVPHITRGDSLLLWGALPAVSGGIIQEILKIAAIMVLIRRRSPKPYQYAALGAVVGCGFGLVEAGYLAWVTSSNLLLGIGLTERVFMILFHVAAGAILAESLAGGYRRLLGWAVVTTILNSFFRYLPLLAQSGTASPQALAIMLAFVSVAFVFLVLLLLKKRRNESHTAG